MIIELFLKWLFCLVFFGAIALFLQFLLKGASILAILTLIAGLSLLVIITWLDYRHEKKLLLESCSQNEGERTSYTIREHIWERITDFFFSFIG